jgi:hypothetical protein
LGCPVRRGMTVSDASQVFERRTGVDLAGAKESDKKKKALSKLRNACAQVRGCADGAVASGAAPAIGVGPLRVWMVLGLVASGQGLAAWCKGP